MMQDDIVTFEPPQSDNVKVLDAFLIVLLHEEDTRVSVARAPVFSHTNSSLEEETFSWNVSNGDF